MRSLSGVVAVMIMQRNGSNFRLTESKRLKSAKKKRDKRQKLCEHDRSLDLQDLLKFTLIVYGCRVVSGVVGLDSTYMYKYKYV